VARTVEHILISRTDSIGDVMLTLPLAGLLKQRFPGVRITFLGRSYTAPVLRCCRHVDHVLTLEELRSVDAPAQLRSLGIDAIVHVFPQREVARWARQARIPLRIGTSHRWWHWITCNERPSFSRRKSDLHEAQLNVKLLAPLGVTEIPDLPALAAWMGFYAPPPDQQVRAMLRPGQRHVILHPLSKGSAVEWGLDRFAELMQRLDPVRYRIIVTGTSAEAMRYRNQLPLHMPHVVDADGSLSLDQLIQLIGASDALVAASTGPLHIAAACGKRAIGLYSPQRPIHPGRWAPIGPDAHALVAGEVEGTDDPLEQIRKITAGQVLSLLDP
jgi:heptosyltransferase-3